MGDVALQFEALEVLGSCSGTLGGLSSSHALLLNPRPVGVPPLVGGLSYLCRNPGIMAACGARVTSTDLLDTHEWFAVDEHGSMVGCGPSYCCCGGSCGCCGCSCGCCSYSCGCCGWQLRRLQLQLRPL